MIRTSEWVTCGYCKGAGIDTSGRRCEPCSGNGGWFDPTPASPAPLDGPSEPYPGNTDGASPVEIMRAINYCASRWQGRARLLGNVRAVDIQLATVAAIVALEAASTTPPTVEKAENNLRFQIHRWCGNQAKWGEVKDAIDSLIQAAEARGRAEMRPDPCANHRTAEMVTVCETCIEEQIAAGRAKDAEAPCTDGLGDAGYCSTCGAIALMGSNYCEHHEPLAPASPAPTVREALDSLISYLVNCDDEPMKPALSQRVNDARRALQAAEARSRALLKLLAEARA